MIETNYGPGGFDPSKPNSNIISEGDLPDAAEALDPQSQKIAELEATVTALTEQATGKITKAQLTARLTAAKPVKPGKG